MAARRSTKSGKRPKVWITSGEVARALNMTAGAIRRWAREGLVDAIKTPGGQYRFRRSAVANLVKSRRTRTGNLAGPDRRAAEGR